MTATTNGTSINYTWSEQSDGLTETLNVCITNDGCTTYTVPATGGYNGPATVTYGYSTQGTITAYATDTANQRAPQAGTVTASATTVAPPPPPPSAAVVYRAGTRHIAERLYKQLSLGRHHPQQLPCQHKGCVHVQERRHPLLRSH